MHTHNVVNEEQGREWKESIHFWWNMKAFFLGTGTWIMHNCIML